ncbi:hypothetical protein E2C01_039676 [Portunus trituberculatus]|uniref:Uncharacterized protein n=1 Tax=Portunus trituberculatus TaxID=210409 RepID=A0A5B7FEF3_PORTR|nr:hypothetical protein [Portunus trituberculatus]
MSGRSGQWWRRRKSSGAFRTAQTKWQQHPPPPPHKTYVPSPVPPLSLPVTHLSVTLLQAFSLKIPFTILAIHGHAPTPYTGRHWERAYTPSLTTDPQSLIRGLRHSTLAPRLLSVLQRDSTRGGWPWRAAAEQK